MPSSINLSLGTAVDITGGTATTAGTATDVAGVDKVLAISYLANAATVADTYTDTITFIITAP